VTETIYSPDGTTIERRYRDAPRWHWEQTGASTGRYVTANTTTGYYPLIRAERPTDTDTHTHDHAIVRDGARFLEQWTRRPWTEDELAARLEAQAPDVVEVIAATLVAGATPALWVQPTGAHDAYLPGAIALDANGDRWRNTLTVPNVWGLDVYGWENLDASEPTGPQPWVQPTGAHDAYAIGDQVTYNGSTWTSTANGNVWAPGVYGWVLA
jgi:hypothetical protein